MKASTSLRAKPAATFLLSICLAAAGCGSPKTAPEVGGAVTMGGKPLVGVIVTFYPVTEERDGLPFARGTTDSVGHYTLTLSNGKPGAVVGQSRVVVNWPPRDRSDTPDKQAKRPAQLFIPVRYTVATETPLVFEVKTGAAQVIDLTLDPNLPAE
jgi:hypothetical protein